MTGRNPIGKKIQSLVVNVALAALLITGIISIVSMSRVREKNKEILITQMETSLYNTIKDKARFADSALGKYTEYAEMLRTIRDEQTKYESLKDECGLMGNVEQIWIPFMKAHSEVSIFLATKTGFLLTYDAHSEIALPPFTAQSWLSTWEGELMLSSATTTENSSAVPTPLTLKRSCSQMTRT